MSTSNLILNTDSYKVSHWVQYPPGMDGMFSYVESRGGVYDRTVFFGLQAILKEYLTRPVTLSDVEEAKEVCNAHGVPFNESGWRYIVEQRGGLLPVTIRAVPEGSLVPTHNALVTVESTDAKCFWMASYLETLLMRVWYPTTVATISWHIKKLIRRYLNETSDDAANQLPFKLHDFGARGVSSLESAALGGLAHLVNFKGTDTMPALLAGRQYYSEPMAAFSIPAAEHSTITAWGREGEEAAYRNMIQQYGKPGAVFACVSDSYNVYAAIEHLWGARLKQQVIDSGATLVVRPDSGNPPDVVEKCAQLLDRAYGSHINSKGFKVLKHVRLIQGDGVNPTSIKEILERLKAAGFAADNIAFGMGGALLQHLNRDTQKFAMKCSAARINGEWIDVFKDPITDPGKTSKKGRLDLVRDGTTREYVTYPIGTAGTAKHSELVEVFRDGRLLKEWTLSEVRARSEQA
ncbi:MAG TPA: nicotinate phosphoribosyltransferase [Steroidobacteraceae bacterium]|nr:nicotinate phosphoribosyltransferase [Steroidobacteraceae bacterium]